MGEIARHLFDAVNRTLPVQEQAMDIDEEELRETFDHFDRDRNNKIDRSEFAELLDALGAEMSADEVQVGFDIIDNNHNGWIEYQEFRAWWGAK